MDLFATCMYMLHFPMQGINSFLSLTLLCPNSDKCLIFPYNIPTWSNIKVIRNKGNDHQTWNVLMFVQILLTSTIQMYGEHYTEYAYEYWGLRG